eukprot:UN09185
MKKSSKKSLYRYYKAKNRNITSSLGRGFTPQSFFQIF